MSNLVIARQAVDPRSRQGAHQHTVGQVFNAAVTASEAGLFRNLLTDVRREYDRSSLIIGALLALVVIASAVLLLVGFAFRQVRAIRLLNESAERMTAGDFETAIRLNRSDELGQLAATFDQLRERLRTTTISRDYLDKVLGNLSEALLVTSHDGYITRANPAACRLLDQREARLLGRPVAEFIAPERRTEFELADSEGRAKESALLGRDGPVVDPAAVALFRLLASVMLLSGLSVVPRALIRRRLRFKEKLIPDLVRGLSKGGFAIILALSGMGVWSLVWGQIAGEAASVVILWQLAGWRPALQFDRTVTRELLGFGGHMILVDVMGALRNIEGALTKMAPPHQRGQRS